MSRPERFAFIVGAPRSGTTSLSRYLEAHPDVCFSVVKEPHFFARFDLRDLPDEALGRFVEAEYLRRYFAHRANHGQALAEGSVSYLFAGAQMEPILRLWPDSKFVICLRDPLEMLPSLHQRLIFNGDETVTEFAQAWALMPARAQGRHVPRGCFDARMLQYAELGRLGTHVERFFRAVGRERCHVVLLEDLIANPAVAYRGLLDFLELRDDGREDFPVHRGGQGFRFAWLQRLLKRPPLPLRSALGGEKLLHRIKPLDRLDRPPGWMQRVFGLRARLLQWNAAPPPAIHLPASLRREMAYALGSEIDLLGRLIGRDLGHWLGRSRGDAPQPALAPVRVKRPQAAPTPVAG
jgi:hypothetical protein